MMKLVCILISTMLVSSQAYAGLTRQSFESIRATGMGGAFIALADDKDALWYNPAGLSNIEGLHWNLLDLQTGADSTNTLNRITGAIFDGNYANLIRTDTQWMNASVRTSVLAKYFGFALYDNIFSFTDFRDIDSLAAEVDISTYNDIGAIMGFGIPLGEMLSIGTSVRVFQRSSIDDTITISDVLDRTGLAATQLGAFQTAIFEHLQSISGLGWGIGVNVGALLTVPMKSKGPLVTLGAHVEDLGGTTFRSFGSTTAPPTISNSYHAGINIKHQLDKDSEFNIAFDYRNIFQTAHIARKLHLGFEYNRRTFAIRAGAYQGYPTFGMSIKFPPHTQINMSTYAGELGSGLYSRGQRWYKVQMVIGFNPN